MESFYGVDARTRSTRCQSAFFCFFAHAASMRYDHIPGFLRTGIVKDVFMRFTMSGPQAFPPSRDATQGGQTV